MRYVLMTLVLMALSFGGGFWWEYSRTTDVRNQLHSANSELTRAQYTVRLCHLQDQLLSLVQDTANRNYGDAASLSTRFFNDVGDEISRTTQPNLKSALLSILSQRDQVTAELAKGDPAAHDLFVEMSQALHQALDTAAFPPTMDTH